MELPERLVDLLAASTVEELTGGHQARVFQLTDHGGNRTIAKVLDAASVERNDVVTRVEIVAALADLDPQVCRPIAIDSRLVTEIAIDVNHTGLITRYEYADGRPPDLADPHDAARMGRALAELHLSMSQLPPTPLPAVAARRMINRDASGPEQLLHGDFNSANVRQLDGVIKIFDFDDCGYGPVAFDVANALYLVLFDTFVNHNPEAYPLFKDAFVGGYCTTSGHDLDDLELNHFVDARIAALERWLNDLHAAPIGIRTATQTWNAVLRLFVDAQCTP